MSATLRDVANAAGVSASTVSRAFTRPEKVDEVTRARILHAADELDYSPNAAARTLITGRTGNLGIVVPDLVNPFFPTVLKGAQSRARDLGFPVLLSDTDEDPAVELDTVRVLARQVDGIVLCSTRMSDAELREAADLLPIVLVNRRVRGIPAVTFDNAGGIRAAVAHLRALGHIAIGYVAGPASSYSNAERRAAYGSAMADAGLEGRELGPYEPSFEGGCRAADDVLVAGVSAVLVYNDVIAIGLVHQLTAYGVSVPAELSVIGFDDIPVAAMVSPGLTTVHIPRADAGRAAVDNLTARLATQGAATGASARRAGQGGPPELPTHLVYRGTTARAPSRGNH